MVQRGMIGAFLIQVLILCGYQSRAFGQTTLELLQAGVCESFEQVPSACQGVLNSPMLSSVWTAPTYGITQEVLGSKIVAVITDSEGQPQATVLDLVATMPYDCGFHYLKLICPTYFRTCVVSNIDGVSLSVPVTPCRSVCNQTNLHCATFWKSHGLPPLDCEQIDSITGGELYPADGSGQPCTAVEDDQITGPVGWVCPPPTHFVAPEDGADMLTGLPCALPCRKTIYLNSQDLDASNIVWLVFNWISIVALTLTILVFLAHPQLRIFPHRTIIYIGVGLFIFHLGFVGNTIPGLHDTLCGGEYTLRLGGWCKFQVFAIYGPSLFAAFWWVFQSFMLFWGVGLLKQDISRLVSLEIPLVMISALYSIGAGLAITLAPNHEQTGGGLTGFPFCSFTPMSGSVSSNLVWGLWFAPMLFGVLAIMVFVIVTVFRVLHNSETLRAGSVIITSQILVICYAADFIWVVASNLSYKAWAQKNGGTLVTSFGDYFVCVLTTFGKPDDCVMEFKVPASLYWNIIICFSLIGSIYAFFMLCRSATRSALCSSRRRLLVSASRESGHSDKGSGTFGSVAGD